MSQKILFADDDPEIREVLRLLLTSEGYEVVEAADGRELLDKLDDSVGLVILDVMMPGTSGYAACAEIRNRSAVPVLFLTARSQDSDKTMGFSVGGDDYLVKPFSYSELISRVKAMLRRYYVYGARAEPSGSVIRCCGNIEIDSSQCLVRQDGREINLTDTEYRLLQRLMEKPGHLRTHEELLRAVWGPEALDDLPLLRVTLTRIRKKLQAAGAVGPVIASYSGVGYLLDDYSDL